MNLKNRLSALKHLEKARQLCQWRVVRLDDNVFVIGKPEMVRLVEEIVKEATEGSTDEKAKDTSV